MHKVHIIFANKRKRKPKEQSRIKEWAIQRHCHHWAHKTKDEDKQSKKPTQHRKKKMEPTNNQVLARVSSSCFLEEHISFTYLCATTL